MATDKPRFSLTIPDDVLAKVEQYQAEQKISTKSKAIHRLIEIGLSQSADDPHRTKYAAMSRVEARYQALDAHGRRVVDLVMDAEAERIAAPVEPVADVVDIRPMIRHYLVPAAAGYAAPTLGEDYEMIPLPENAPAGADFCITVRGDSMEPYIPDGSLAFVKRGAPLEEFDVGVFFLDGDVYVKQWCVDSNGTLYLLSANPDREEFNKIVKKSAAETVVCFGKVLGIKKLPPPEYR